VPSNWTNLQVFDFSGTSVVANPALTPAQLASSFDNLPNLVTLNMKALNYHAPIPNFVGCVKLQTMEISQNAFTGPIPATWAALTSLRLLSAGSNFIRDPIDALNQLPVLTEIICRTT